MADATVRVDDERLCAVLGLDPTQVTGLVIESAGAHRPPTVRWTSLRPITDEEWNGISDIINDNYGATDD